MPGPNSLHLPNFGYAICFVVLFACFFVLVLCFVVFYCFVLFGVLYAAKMKDTAKVKLQTANKKNKQTRTLGFCPSVL